MRYRPNKGGLLQGLKCDGTGQNGKKWRKLTGFGHPKFAGTNFGWFGATFDFWSIFAILTSISDMVVPRNTPNFRHAHTPSDALMSRLTPRQRQCLTELPNAGDNWGTKDGVTKSYFEHHWRGGPQASADVAALQQEVKELRALVASQAGAPQQSKL